MMFKITNFSIKKYIWGTRELEKEQQRNKNGKNKK